MSFTKETLKDGTTILVETRPGADVPEELHPQPVVLLNWSKPPPSFVALNVGGQRLFTSPLAATEFPDLDADGTQQQVCFVMRVEMKRREFFLLTKSRGEPLFCNPTTRSSKSAPTECRHWIRTHLDVYKKPALTPLAHWRRSRKVCGIDVPSVTVAFASAPFQVSSDMWSADAQERLTNRKGLYLFPVEELPALMPDHHRAAIQVAKLKARKFPSVAHFGILADSFQKQTDLTQAS